MPDFEHGAELNCGADEPVEVRREKELVVDDGKTPALEVSQTVPHGLKLFR